MCWLQNKEFLLISVGCKIRVINKYYRLQNNCPCVTYLVTRIVSTPLVISTLTLSTSLQSSRLLGYVFSDVRGKKREKFLLQLNVYSKTKPNECMSCVFWLITDITNRTSSFIKWWLRSCNWRRSYINFFYLSVGSMNQDSGKCMEIKRSVYYKCNSLCTCAKCFWFV